MQSHSLGLPLIVAALSVARTAGNGRGASTLHSAKAAIMLVPALAVGALASRLTRDGVGGRPTLQAAVCTNRRGIPNRAPIGELGRRRTGHSQDRLFAGSVGEVKYTSAASGAARRSRPSARRPNGESYPAQGDSRRCRRPLPRSRRMDFALRLRRASDRRDGHVTRLVHVAPTARSPP